MSSTENQGTSAERAPRAQASPVNDIVIDILWYLWLKRRLIATVFAITIPLYVVILLLIPVRFRAEATVIIMPPRFTSEVRTEPLSVATAKIVLGSGEIVRGIIDRIGQARNAAEKMLGANRKDPAAMARLLEMTPEQIDAALGTGGQATKLSQYLASLRESEVGALLDFDKTEIEEMTVEVLSEQLESEDIVEKKTASDIKMTPLLKLLAVSNTGPRAQLIVNTWASLFENKYEELSTKRTVRQFESIQRQHRDSQAELADIQTTIVAFKTENNIELYQQMINEYMADFKEYTNQLVLKEFELRGERRKLVEMQNIQNAVETGGKWVGGVDVIGEVGDGHAQEMPEVVIRRQDRETSGLATSANGQPGAPEIRESRTVPVSEDTSATIELYGNLRGKVLQTKEEMLQAMDEYSSFYLAHPVYVLEKEREQLQKDYLEAVGRLRVGTTRITVLRRTLADIDTQLSATAQFLVVSKDVPDINIADAIRGGQTGGLKSLSRVQFQREEFNPSWTALQDQKVKFESELALTENELRELETVVPLREKQLRELEHRYNQAKLGEKLVEEKLTRWTQASEIHFSNYMHVNDQIYNAAKQSALLEEEVELLQRSVAETKARAEEYQKLYNNALARLQILELQQKAVQRNADLLLQKLQSAQIAVREEVSDVSIAASAVTPMKHYFPPRTILFVLMTFVTGAVLLGLLARTRYLEIKAG